MKLAHFVCILFWAQFSDAETPNFSIDPKPISNLGCQDSHYYDTTFYNCKPCGTNAVQNKTSGKVSYRLIFVNGRS